MKKQKPGENASSIRFQNREEMRKGVTRSKSKSAEELRKTRLEKNGPLNEAGLIIAERAQ